MKNKEQTNACYGCFGAANGDCDECAKDRSNADCAFRNKDGCGTALKEWAESECIKRPVISKKDRAFLDYIKEKYKYIAKDESGKLYAYNSKPYKNKNRKFWCGSNGFVSYCMDYNIDFPMIKWSDSEPWLIEDLKKLEVVDSYE